MKTNIKMDNYGVAEIIGAVLLLAMAIAAFSVIYINVLSDDGPGLDSYATIVGKMENGHPMFENQRGNGIGWNSKIYYYNYDQLIYTDIVNKIIESNDDNSLWDIGESLLSNYSEPGKEIEARIFDSITGDMIWWGTLQEGGMLQSLGARWYFDENTGTVAHDSLNDNDGTLYGPHWSDSIKYNGTSALEFDGTDSVFVKGDSYSLNLIESLSVEACFKFGDTHYLTNITYGIPFGYYPNFIHIYKDIYAVAFANVTSSLGSVETIELFPDGGGTTKNIFNNNIVFGDSVTWPKLSHVSGDVYIVAYETKSNRFYLKNLRIANNGTTGPMLGELAFDPKEDINDYDIIKISDNHIALIYREEPTNKGIIKTYNITDYGLNILENNYSYISEFDMCYEPDLVHVYGDTYAIAYSNKDKSEKNGDGVLKTVEITPEGTINQINDSFIFDSNNGINNPDIELVSNNTFVITYSADDGRGLLATVEIADNGHITPYVINTLEYEKKVGDKGDPVCIRPKIIHMIDSDFFVVTYEGKQHTGNVVIFKIAQNGHINHDFLTTFQFNGTSQAVYEPDIIQISKNVFAISFRSGIPHKGDIKTFSLSSIFDNLPPYNRGIIYKQDTWGIYVNKTHLVATIGNNIYSVKPPSDIIYKVGWNTIILTYNRFYLNLSCNGQPVISEKYANFNTNNPSKNIFIGETFNGFIDNVFILEKS